jgi:hypothetical protein
LFLLVQAVVVLPAAAQFRPLEGREYREFLNPVNPVRGEALVGLAVLPSADAPRGQTVEVWLPDKFSGELQVETLTADGRFRGEGVYTGSSGGGQWVPLTLIAKDKASSARPGDPATLALAVRGPGATLFVARWGSAPVGPATRIRLYVNSRRADMFLRAGEKVVRCASLNIPQPLRFDAYCDLAAGDVPANGQIGLIRRDQFDEQTQTVTVNVRGIR